MPLLKQLNRTAHPDTSARTGSLACLLIVLCGMTTPLAGDDTPASVPPTTPTGKLYWSSGDNLAGRLLECSAEELVWRSPLFVEPLRIQRAAISSIRFDETDATTGLREAFRITLQNGDILFGQLTAATEDEVQFHNPRHGDFRLLRDQIESIKRIDTPDLIYLGPRGLEGWGRPIPSRPAQTSPAEATSELGWRAQSNGQLVTALSDRAIYRPFELPKQAEIEVILESNRLPSFILALGQHRNSSLRIESWDDVLVVLSRFQFVEVAKLTTETRRVHLLLFLDQTANQLTVCSPTGEKLAEITDARGFHQLDGLQVWNRDGELKLAYLRIDRWHGELPQPHTAGRSRVQSTDGKVLYGNLPEFKPGETTLRFGEERELALDQLSQIVFTEAGVTPPVAAEAVSLSWKDGSFLTGNLLQIADGKALVQTPYSREPLSATLDSAQRVVFPQNQLEVDQNDQLYYPGGSLAGTLEIDGQHEQPLRWRPVGGLNSSPLLATGAARFVRGTTAAKTEIDNQQYPDILYLLNGDVLPCRINLVQDDALQLQLPFTEIRSIPVTAVKAVEFRGTQQTVEQGFGDAGWKRLLGRPTQTDESLTFTTSGAIGHPSILQGGLVKFRLNWAAQQFSQVSVQLFGDKPGSPQGATVLAIHVNGDRLWITDQSEEMQAANPFAGGGLRGAAMVVGAAEVVRESDALQIPEGQADIVLALSNDILQITVNDAPLKSIRMQNKRNRNQSLTFQANINSVTRNLPYGKNPLSRGIVIDNFEVKQLDGSVAKQFILEETRDKALLIPRFRRSNPHTHLLLAPNGDLLRGRLEAVDDQQVRFESQLESLRFDRQRIAAIVWMHPSEYSAETVAAEPEIQPPAEAEMRLRIGGDFSLSMQPEQVVDEHLTGTAAVLGRCTIPTAAIQEVTLGGDASSLESLAAYSRWIPQYAGDPHWDMPDAGSEQSSPALQLVGTTVEDFALPTIAGTTFRLSEHKGKVIVLDFWASWCGPCVAALPAYIEATSAFDEQEVLFVAVNLQETSQVVRKFLEDKRLSPLVPLDESGGVAQRFRVSGIPHSVVISPQLEIEKVQIGYRPNAGAELKQTIEKILDGTWERPAPATAPPASTSD